MFNVELLKVFSFGFDGFRFPTTAILSKTYKPFTSMWISGIKHIYKVNKGLNEDLEELKQLPTWKNHHWSSRRS
jgi:hypothetical protein